MFEIDHVNGSAAAQGAILIVDDHPPSLFVLEAALKAAELTDIIHCQDSRQVIPILAEQRVAAILLDLRMPFLSGEELLPLLSKDFADIPVLIVTGNDDVNTAVNCMKAGAFDYVVKPVDKNRLAASVKHALAVRGLRDENRYIRERAEQQILRLAYFDGVTGLPNRKLIKNRLEQAIGQASRHGTSVAVLCLDIDHFERVNDSLGHQAGDRLLVEITARLLRCVRDTDYLGKLTSFEASHWDGSNTVGRVGGDEFVILLSDISDPKDAAGVAERIKGALATPITLDELSVYVDLSIGISHFPEDGGDAVTMLKNADAAMHYTKRSGRNRYQFYTAEINRRVRRQLLLENDLRRGLQRGEFVLHFQPRVDACGGTLVAAEALLRWARPGGELVMPGEFIPAAEQTGLIVPLGDWVLNHACRQISAWRAAGLQPITVSVNLSAVQFRQADLAERVARALHAFSVEPQLLELELTETSLMESVDSTAAQLAELKNLGVRLAVDDFGTGYSSLSYLQRFPLDVLKIDRSFVNDIDSDSADTAILQAVISLGRSLRLQVIGEGVETPAQERRLRALGCDQLQGFLLGRPMPAERFQALLSQAFKRELVGS